jgi:hypothetical protein
MSSQRREITEGQNNEGKFSNMKNRNNQLIAVLFVVALALAPIVQAMPGPSPGPTYPPTNDAPQPGGGPTRPPANEAPSPDGGPVRAAAPTGPENVQMPVITIHSTGDVARGKTGAFVLNMNPAVMLGGMYVKFSVSGTAIPGVDYVALVSPSYIGPSGYGVIQVQTLPDPRGSANRQSYSVVITLESGAGYTVGQPSSATVWIKP